ncbi:MAG: tRNA pseudouridine(38-40) synthase TruA [Rhodothermaceae bacterium]|nr:tRNA pseudouridine(38-40) synthase TruA [Bacteroidota bacterium]MXX97609.1 tRNA pseudouridine(38-40) synthase TruA [Rhodothermaceae bacterium]MXZ57927.1 tRNA pseudouridine(38-40) synthase TruA [Rhodothermaceae bacterium]MYB91046.1 tRNA pseudouridine(38-40) synthase TruA [Rhodothermaceae bacterium]MYD67618.1 tRNA pseudouridine(38-40) synthase TruA [Rhodothermaceae bacterium]
MPVYALLLEYDGSKYSGWQRQKAHPTIQAEVEEALRTFLRCDELQITGSGRTDAGVHARGQVAHFECQAISTDQWRRLVRALNGLLPPPIAVLAAAKTHDGFHSRYDAMRRTYHYHISSVPLALDRNQRLFIPAALDYDCMNRACDLLIGIHHFGAFCRTRSATTNRVCTIYYAQWEPEALPGYWKFVIEANRFLHGMVRSLAGTLIEIGCGQRSVQDLGDILASQDRREAGPAAPAHALTLDHVTYAAPLFED